MSSNTDTVLSTASGSARLEQLANNYQDDDEQDVEADDSYQGPDFEPIIPLPDEVEVKTGEEEEKVLFSSRAKLFRFIEKQWKERGLGEIKILYREDTNQARVVMRREQVLKVCANHYILDDATIEFKSPSDRKIVTWKAMDYSDDGPRLEQFCCKFKTEDLGVDFKAKYEEARDKVKNGTAKVPSKPATLGGPKTDGKDQKPGDNPFDKFKPKVGSWECTGCYVVNPGDITTCPACQTLKPGTKAPAKPAFAPSAGGGFKISSGTASSTPNSGFGAAPGFGAPSSTTTSTAPAVPGFGVAPGFGAPSSTTTSTAPAVPGFGVAPGFGAPSSTTTSTAPIAPGFGAPGFGTLPSTTTSTAPVVSAFKSSTSAGFNFGGISNVTSTTAVTASSGFGVPSSGFGQPASGFGVTSATTPAQTAPAQTAPAQTAPAQAAKPGFSFMATTTTSASSGFTFAKPVTTVASSSTAKTSTTTSSVATSGGSTFPFAPTTAQAPSIFGSQAPSKDAVAKPSIFGAGSTTSSTFTFGQTAGASKPFSFGSNTSSSTPASDLLKNLATEKGTEKTPADGKSFGGFTFSSTPVIADQQQQKSASPSPAVAAATTTPEKPAPAAVKDSAPGQQPKSNIFANFSFNSPPKPSTPGGVSAITTAAADSTTKPATTSATAAPIMGASATLASFSDLVKTTDPKSAFNKSAEKPFGGAGQPVFKAAASTSQGEGTEAGEDGDEEYEPDVDFKPIVPLPDLVEVKTGEEEEEKLFCSRARLYRHDVDTKQWKERGIGELKILRHAQTKRCRILMRREQVLKLCANHFITQDMKLSPLMSSDRAWCWLAQDFSEGEVTNDNLAVRFKTPDIAQQFKDVFQKCQADADSVEPATRPEPSVKCPGSQTLMDLLKTDKEKNADAPSSSKPATKGFGNAFKQKPGQWECQGCYVQNPADVVKCPACNTMKPGATDKDAPAPMKFGTSTGGGFTISGSQSSSVSSGFGAPATSSAVTSSSKAPTKGFGDIFKPKTGAWECQGCYVQNTGDTVKCVACNTLKPGATDPAKDAAAPVKFGAGTGGGFTISGAPQSSTSSGFGAAPSSVAQSSGFEVSSSSGFGSTTSSGFGAGGSGFTFGAANASTTTSATTSAVAQTTTITTSQSGFTFGSSTSSGFNFSLTPNSGFGTPTKPTVTMPSSTSTPAPPTAAGATSPLKYVFGQENASFSFTPVTPQPRTRQDSHRSRHDSITKSPDVADEYYESEGDDSQIYFEPLVHLDKVEVKTGEEDEQTLYCHRAKLYRYTNGEWKERGLGDVKILKHQQSGKVRILMRREKILKLCLNHHLTPDLQLKPMANADGKALVWFALDCSDGEPSHEQLAIRFKTKDIASDFEKAFDSAKADAVVSPVKGQSASNTESQRSKAKKDTKATAEAAKDTKDFSFSSDSPVSTTKPVSGFKFTPPKLSPASFGNTGSTSTFGGFSFGSGSSQKSPSVFGGSSQTTPTSSGSPLSKGKNLLHSLMEESKDINKSSDVEITGEDKPAASLQQKARDLQLPDTFYNYQQKASCAGCAGCDDCDDDDDDIQIVNVEEASEDQIKKAQQLQLPRNFYLYEKAHPCPGCLGCRDENEDVFALIGKAQPKTPQATKSTAEKEKVPEPSRPTTEDSTSTGFNLFTKAAANSFSFADIAANPDAAFTKDSNKQFSWSGSGAQVFGQSPTKAKKDGEEVEGEVAPSQDIHFEPLVQLPEVEVKTGEEDEESLYSQRAKLFRFTDAQWKERGIGEIKLLRHKHTGRIRILMRREQIHKLCCNHNLTADLVLKPMATSETAWCWNAMDYTNQEGTYEHFAIKFKNRDIAGKFKEKFDECQKLCELLSTSTTEDAAEESVGETSRVEDLSQTEEVDTTRESEENSTRDTDQFEESGEYDEEEYGDEDEDYEDEDPIFQKRATLSYVEGTTPVTVGMGELRVYIDEDVNGARILMEKDDGTRIANHIICMEHHIQCNEKKHFCEWTAKDYSTDEAVKRTFRVNFSSKNTVADFRNVFQHGKDLAVDSAIREL